MKTQLKINIKSLAAESRIIRKEINLYKFGEKRVIKWIYASPLRGADPKCQELIQHRTWHLGNEARAAQLIYAFVRCVPYSVVERTVDKKASKWKDAWKRIRSKCGKLGIEYPVVVRWMEGDPDALKHDYKRAVAKVG